MNKTFQEYATSTAFAVQLSKLQCNALLRCAAGQADSRDHAFLISIATLRSLEGRGFVFWHHRMEGMPDGFGGLTKAGELMAGLLTEAGLTIENTNTVSVLKNIVRHHPEAAA
ncbi:MAG: hypothetical protein ACRYG5_09870 [Janthinobacterium lividum]